MNFKLVSRLITIMSLICSLNVFWVFIEFIIYLFKDIEFNWYCVISLIIMLILYSIFILYGISKYKKSRKNYNNVKSKFQQRLDEAMKK